MKDERRLPVRVPAHLPIDAMPVCDIEHARLIGLNRWI
jgi:hypothetical protein